MTLLALSSVFAFGNASSIGGPSHEAFVSTTNPCDLAAPTNFHVQAIGSTWVTLAWTPTVLGVDHRVKTFRASDGVMVDNQIVGAAMAPALTVIGLQPGVTYFSTICAICPDGTDSQYFALSPNYDTLIGELIVMGFNESPNNESCGIRNPGDYCEFKINGAENIFKIRPINGITWRKFRIQKITVEGVAINRVSLNGLFHPYYSFKLDGQPAAFVAVRGKTYEVIVSGLVIAKFELSEYPSVNAGYITWSMDNTGYEIIRLTAGPNGLSDPSGGKITELDYNNSEAQDRDIQDQTSAELGMVMISPNPFTDNLDVYLPQNAAEQVKLRLFNLSGQMVLDQQYTSGQTQYSLSTANLSPGFYLLRIEADGEVQTLKVVKSE